MRIIFQTNNLWHIQVKVYSSTPTPLLGLDVILFQVLKCFFPGKKKHLLLKIQLSLVNKLSTRFSSFPEKEIKNSELSKEKISSEIPTNLYPRLYAFTSKPSNSQSSRLNTWLGLFAESEHLTLSVWVRLRRVNAWLGPFAESVYFPCVELCLRKLKLHFLFTR